MSALHPFRAAASSPDGADHPTYWSRPASELLAELGSSDQGLSAALAARRLADNRPPLAERAPGFPRLLLEQLRSPLVLILIFGAVVALVVRDWLDAVIILAIVLCSAALGAWHERRASHAIEQLRQRIAVRAQVRRDGQVREIPATEVVPGDVVELSAGSLIPADGVLLEARNCFVSQGLLTGETFPVEKQPGTVAAGAALAERNNCLFMGTSLRSGSASLLVVRSTADSEFGRISASLALRPPETEFERGLRHFGTLLLRVMLVMTVLVLGANILLQRPTIDTLLFTIALAVGLSPELLPAILSITLAKGAQRMAQAGVIVRHLNAIENLGSMDVLCTDKTGTLTRGVVQLDGALDATGNPDAGVLHLAWLNAHLQSGLRNPLDEAIVAAAGTQPNDYRKIDETPYDFTRKRLSVLVRVGDAGPLQTITKGALDSVLDICSWVRNGSPEKPLDDTALTAIRERYAQWSAKGYRVLGLACKTMASDAQKAEESGLTFVGFLLFFDPPEPGVQQTLTALHHLGVQVKVITGDNQLVARHVAEAVGLDVERIVTGAELTQMKDEALLNLAPRVSLFAEVDPNQKERIILALQKTGHVVGFLGDGINDAPALHCADVGISVDNAVDVAKEAADFVLLKHDLDVLRQGIDEGRHTFANTLKYIFITTSANFGNMISMAVASLFLPFLPLLAKQVLLNNFLSDIPAVGIASDRVDREWERTPHRWDLRMVRNFMIGFGLVSSLFDLLTFGVLLWFAGEVAELFRTGWFVESLLTEILIIFVVRTWKPCWRSRPGRLLLGTSLAIIAVTIALPYSPLAVWFGLVPLPPMLLLALLGICLLYAGASELFKHYFYRHHQHPTGRARRQRGQPVTRH
ncbi:magnesium-translocating P-type ATPase [Pseudomonas sp. MAP12]|uniref:Magnesium-transporting ATPase, P-type 1 n=1 Tax=Geopseudomonas aromaticivorans TaxID=2849492 RepID=A0ABS6MT37_9GAMM|nr:magnesium-translocating P-type ATPase [Pseudomonas aromaticivorans]MBV2131975.1 magnesium-translocating P-type ATPase [Pseudomonas aromaticivorans]